MVVGAGIFGVTAALALTRRGRSVTLVDQSRAPARRASSTDVSKAIRMDYGSDVFYHELAEEALDGWDRWNHDWPRPLYHPSGFLVLSPEPMRPGGFEFESRRTLVARGYDPEPVDAAVLSRRFPAWNAARYPDGYLSTRGGWAESGAVVAHLLRLAEDVGVQVVTGAVTQLLARGSRLSGVRVTAASAGDGRSSTEVDERRAEPDGTETLPARLVVVCAGAWTPTIAPWLADRLEAVAQPVVHVLPEAPQRFRGDAFPPFAADISGTGWYGFPALTDGRVKIGHHGPGRAVAAHDRGPVSVDHLRKVRLFLKESIPELATAPIVTTRVCLYCDVFDGDPFIGVDPGREGLVVASGGSGHAFKFAPVLGDLIADAAEGASNRWSARLGWRARGADAAEQARHRIHEE